MSNFTLFHNVFYAICFLKSFNSHIPVVVCSFFKSGTISKWCRPIREWVKSINNSGVKRPLRKSLLKAQREQIKMLLTSSLLFTCFFFPQPSVQRQALQKTNLIKLKSFELYKICRLRNALKFGLVYFSFFLVR